MKNYPFVYEKLLEQMKKEDIKFKEIQLELPAPCLEYEEPEAEDLMMQSYGACVRCPESPVNYGNCGFNADNFDCLMPFLYGTDFTVL